jgi:hypothetical protein
MQRRAPAVWLLLLLLLVLLASRTAAASAQGSTNISAAELPLLLSNPHCCPTHTSLPKTVNSFFNRFSEGETRTLQH